MSERQPRIHTDVHDHVLVVTIDRPEARNAFDRQAAEEMHAAMDLLDNTQELFVGIITGAGGNFCSGADLIAKRRGENLATDRGGFGIMRRPSRKPLIAAVEGFALAGGLEVCLSCDLIVSSSAARFGLPEVRHNAVAIGGGLFRLPRRMPYHLAMEMALTAKIYDASHLERWGVINQTCPEGKALETALELAAALLENGPTALAASKEIMFQLSGSASDDEAFAQQLAIAQPALESEDLKEGLAAFAEKRKPVWKGV